MVDDLEELLQPQAADDDRPALPLYSLPEAEVDRLISQCSAALQAHGRDFETAGAADKGDFLAAFESTMVLLLELRDHYPLKAGDIDVILAASGYPVREN
ncbi:hypothetical protein [Devosia sediminis]|uniref:Uncharacterized protein n=1 Tax=Devosia sediminis TaxID=2798801 RepID=A0A934MK75_9HYPH|nr:hypothetical protein [Devosia sediminis]MBJ3783840.1 hypothetical protein [Devosia sediminis]